MRKKFSPANHRHRLTAKIETPPPRHGERLVGLGFRSWMLGYQTGEIGCWERGWNLFASELGAERAKQSITELACWVRSVHTSSARKIEVYPLACAGFCEDECMAISMIAACQNDVCPAMRACAYALVGDSAIDEVVDGADRFADALGQQGIILRQEAIANAAASVSTPQDVSAAN